MSTRNPVVRSQSANPQRPLKGSLPEYILSFRVYIPSGSLRGRAREGSSGARKDRLAALGVCDSPLRISATGGGGCAGAEIGTSKSTL